MVIFSGQWRCWRVTRRTPRGIQEPLRCWCCRITAEPNTADDQGQEWCARYQQRAMAVLEDDPACTAGHPGTNALLALPRRRRARRRRGAGTGVVRTGPAAGNDGAGG